MYFDDKRHFVIYGPASKPATILHDRHFHSALWCVMVPVALVTSSGSKFERMLRHSLGYVCCHSGI